MMEERWLRMLLTFPGRHWQVTLKIPFKLQNPSVCYKRESGENIRKKLSRKCTQDPHGQNPPVWYKKRERGEYPEEALAEVHARPSRSKSARVVQKRERGEYAEEALAEVHTGPSGSTKGSNDGGKVAENVVNISSTALAGDSEDPSPDNVDEISESTVLQTGLPVMRNPFDVDLQEEISHHFASPPMNRMMLTTLNQFCLRQLQNLQIMISAVLIAQTWLKAV
uniref:Uncharacterized protein n=1 Tax=Lutzomyia longipalpis TaxID=7200 RepID=A0A1B0CI89_LUTLO